MAGVHYGMHPTKICVILNGITVYSTPTIQIVWTNVDFIFLIMNMTCLILMQPNRIISETSINMGLALGKPVIRVGIHQREVVLEFIALQTTKK